MFLDLKALMGLSVFEDLLCKSSRLPGSDEFETFMRRSRKRRAAGSSN